ncbi:sulfatase-like hydrolase/transferase [Delftia acidovorans]|uniref:sulfatase-like hydrolase/transferase n=1 Tax=Delftia acidovorans TaxID=80866 RepID=UPI0018E7150B|nr:sulfatase-like hydrolase/transferase [Delftia acidovorans]MBJ2144273.1 sulfatase-like hydrolase/transferase [Delftia acidovorans]
MNWLSSKLRNIRRSIDTSKWLLLAIFLLLNGLFQWASIHFGYKRYFISAEIFLAFLIVSLGIKWIGSAIFIFSVFQEIFLGMTKVFYLFNYSQISTIASFAFEAKPSYLGALAICSGLLALLFIKSIKLLRSVSWKRIFTTGIMLALGQGALSFREGNFLYPSYLERRDLIFGSSSYFIGNLQSLNEQAFFLTSNDNVEYHRINQPSAASLSLSEPLPEKILFIIAESWGKPKDNSLLEKQTAAIKSSPNSTDIQFGSIHALGSTIFGEFRELCGKIPTKLKFKNISRDEKSVGECLPASLYTKGYKTISLHGAHSTMYGRLEWYPVVGFHEMIFREILPISQKTECYSFPGYCDKYLFSTVKEKLLSTQKTFVYWMTLNSHTPYDQRDVTNFRENICKSTFGENYNHQLCIYHQLHTQFFEELAEMINDKKMHGVKVVIVGDHAPIFNDESSRLQFEADQVPMLQFTVR